MYTPTLIRSQVKSFILVWAAEAGRGCVKQVATSLITAGALSLMPRI
jgi:hypothetical protein